MKEILDFLRDLEKNNNRKWFSTNKERYQEVLKKWNAFCEKIQLDKEPGCLDALKKFITKFRNRTPELISVYTRC